MSHDAGQILVGDHLLEQIVVAFEVKFLAGLAEHVDHICTGRDPDFDPAQVGRHNLDVGCHAWLTDRIDRRSRQSPLQLGAAAKGVPGKETVDFTLRK